MQPATLAEIKRELKELSVQQLIELCLRLGRFKKDNKELLTYLLFEKMDEQAYVSSIKNLMDEAFEEINHNGLYFVKKSLRKILRIATKMIRYSGNKQTEVEVLIHFCKTMKASFPNMNRSVQLLNLHERQITKIKKALKGLHEDLQADYLWEVDKL